MNLQQGLRITLAPPHGLLVFFAEPERSPFTGKLTPEDFS
jgi:hypothetical protein